MNKNTPLKQIVIYFHIRRLMHICTPFQLRISYSHNLKVH